MVTNARLEAIASSEVGHEENEVLGFRRENAIAVDRASDMPPAGYIFINGLEYLTFWSRNDLGHEEIHHGVPENPSVESRHYARFRFIRKKYTADISPVIEELRAIDGPAYILGDVQDGVVHVIETGPAFRFSD